jgi:hypothetical protein
MSTLKVVNILNPSAGNIAMVTDILGNTAFGGNVGIGTGGGNISFNGSALVIGTQNALPLQFRTSGTQQMVISSTGNVGIGSATPLQLLHVQGGSYFTSNVGIGSSTPQQTLDVQGNVNVLNTVIMGSSFLRNRLINGAMKIAQRGTSQNLTTSMAYGSLDRWAAAYATAGTGTFVQSAAGPTGFDYSMQLQRTNGQTSTNALIIAQAIETQNSNDLAGQSITLSFYARAGSTFSATSGALNVYVLAGQGTDQSVASMVAATWTGMTYPINSSVSLTPNGAWIRYSVSGTVPASTTQLGVEFFYYGTGTAGASDWVQITGVQLEPGPVATPFERRLYGQELALCQRYYEKSYDTTVNPGSVTSTNAFSLIASSSLVRYPAFFKVTKRIVNGTITFYSTAGTSGNIRNNSAGSDLAVTTVTGSNNGYASSNGGTTNNEYIGQWTIDAEL